VVFPILKVNPPFSNPLPMGKESFAVTVELRFVFEELEAQKLLMSILERLMK